tara:strand:+ start:488 stop:2434 length:1947 start_codon:yes stop_codon:yes gene_type:complete
MLLDYRKDIDGLRAIAVLLVVLFHMGLPINGGFVGVDIFFVISGFLIASLIQKQILRGKFTFSGFYLHRMRRILPALILVIVSTFVFGWFILMPEEFNFFISSVIYSLVGFSNVYFYGKGQDYFAADTETIQLLHTWSLGVEEQFYFIAPIFLLILFKYFKDSKWFNIILISLVIIGFIVSHYYALTNQAGAYYLLPARFFELLMGVVLALNYKEIPVSNNNIFNNFLGVLAISLILLPALFITKKSLFPSYNAFFVCLGSCLVIYLGKLDNKIFLTKILSFKPLVFIGLISYSLYLWHWPIISILHSIGYSLNNLERVIVILLLIIASYFSWRFVEQPFRNKLKMGFLATFICLLLLPALLAQHLKDTSRKNHGFQNQRFYGDVESLVITSQVNVGKIGKYCHNNYSDINNENKCVIGDLDVKLDTLVIGDSHANAIAPALELMFKDAKKKAKLITADATLYLNTNKTNKYSNFLSKERVDIYIKTVNEAISSEKYNNIVLTGYFNGALNLHKDMLQLYLEETIDYILEKNINLYIVKDVYSIENEKVYCAIYEKMFNFNNNCNTSYSYLVEKNKEIDTILNNLESKYKNVVFIDPKKIMCDKDYCYTSIDNTALYRDGGHITLNGSQYIGNEYINKYGNPFKNIQN